MLKGKDRFEIVSKSEVDAVLHELKPVLGRLNAYVNKEDSECVFKRQIVGSTSRGVVTRVRGGNKGFDVDINLVLPYPGDGQKYIGKNIHTLYLNGLREAIKGTSFSDPEESSSVFTIKCLDKKNSKILYSADLAVIYYDPQGNLHYLQYNKSNGGFGFQIRELPRNLDEMVETICECYDDGEDAILEAYLNKKNSNYDDGKHSFILYIEAVMDLYNQIPDEDDDCCDDDDYDEE